MFMNTLPSHNKKLRRPLATLVILGILLMPGGLIASSSTSADPVVAPQDKAAFEEQKAELDPQASVNTEAEMTNPGTNPLMTAKTQQDMKAAPAPDAGVKLQATAEQTGGRWSRLPTLPAGTNAYHMSMGPGGKILLVAGSGNSATVFKAKTFKAYVWNPKTGITKNIRVPEDMFCAGHALLTNGQALIAGGTTNYSSPWKGETSLYTFNFSTEKFTKRPNMNHGRWYPTVVTSPSGYALIVGGLNAAGRNAGTSESMNPKTYQTKDTKGTQAFPLYPHIYATADHRYFFTGAGYSTASKKTNKPGFWDPTTNKYVAVGGMTQPNQRGSASSCRIGDARNQDFIVMGGGWPATNSTRIIKLKGNASAFRAGPNLPAAKGYLNCVPLPDGTVLEVGGGSANQIAKASREVSLLTSANATRWTPMNPLPAGEHRLYHSIAFLMDDGSVVSAFSNPSGQARSNTVLRYEPPYLFKGPRPTITSLPSAMTYGKTYSIKVSANTRKVTIMTASSPTHAMDVNMKQVTLPVVNGRVTLNFNSFQFGRAYVRVFAISDQGVPSVAKWSRIQ